MKRVIVVIVAILSLMVLISLYLVSCGGGGGGNGVEQQPPPPGGAGIGADGVAIFWYPYDTNIDIGAGNSVQETSDHGFVVAGYQAADFSSAHDVFLMKTDSRGTALWKRRFAWTGGAEANSVRQTSDGGYLVAGQAKMSTGNTNVYVLKTDALGNPAAGWPKTYGGTGNSVGYAALEVVNGYMIVGYRYVNPQENENVYVILTDTAGNVVRENFNYTSFCAAGGEIGRAIAVMPDGNYVIAGTTGCYGWKSVLLKIDSQDGHELWRKVYGTSAASSEAAYSVAVASDGFVLAGSRALVSGQPPVVGPLDALVIKTDQNGNELWRRTYGDSDQDVAFAVAPAQNNGSLVIGYTQSYGGKVDPNYSWQYQDVFMIRLDSSGNTLWQKVKGNRPMASDVAGAISAVSDGGFAITGSSGGNVLLAKFDKNGGTVNLGATDLTIKVPSNMGIISFGNAIDTAAAGVTGIKDPRDVGANTIDLLIAKLKNDPVSSFCTGGGTYAFSPAPALPLLVPRTFTLTFVGCETGPAGDTTTLNGSATITVDNVSGGNDLVTATYTVQTTLTSINITAAETGGTLSSTITGGMRFQRQATSGNFAEVSQSITTPSPATLTVSESDETTTHTRILGPFTMHDTVTTTGAFGFGVLTDAATVDPGLGPLTVAVLTPVQGPDLNSVPSSGSFQMTATDNSRLTATITNGVAMLAVDTDGDGTVDGTVSASWDFLD